MSKSKKDYAIKKCSFIINLIEGAIAVFAVSAIYAFIFEPNNIVHQTGIGVIVLLIWLTILFTPNIMFKFIVNLSKKDMVVFQILPLLLGAIFYVVFFQIIMFI